MSPVTGPGREKAEVAMSAGGTPTRALVTGAAGFAGQWLCRDLLRHGWTVTGTSRSGEPDTGILEPGERARVTWMRQDLLEPDAVDRALDTAKPDAIFHLAAVSFVPTAGSDPMRAFDTNCGVAVRLLDEVRRRRVVGALDPVVVCIGSGEQYGRHADVAMPLGEDAECRPATLYAATKMAQEVFALEAFRGDGVRVTCTRSFNHSGPGQARAFVLPGLVQRAVEARREGRARVSIGNGHSVRDFLHVEDAVRAYVLLAEHGVAGETYNVSSGEGVSVQDVAGEVFRAAGLQAEAVGDASLRRAHDVPVLIGRNDKLRADTGWTPHRSRADIISDLLHAASS